MPLSSDELLEVIERFLFGLVLSFDYGHQVDSLSSY